MLPEHGMEPKMTKYSWRYAVCVGMMTRLCTIRVNGCSRKTNVDDDCQVPLAMPQRVKREAHDVILDFIRSRPPLKPVRSFYN